MILRLTVKLDTENSFPIYDFAIILNVIIIIFAQITTDFRKTINLRSFAKKYFLNHFYVAKMAYVMTYMVLTKIM